MPLRFILYLVGIENGQCVPIVRIGHNAHIERQRLTITCFCPKADRHIGHILGIYLRRGEPRRTTRCGLGIEFGTSIASMEIRRFCFCTICYTDKRHITWRCFFLIPTMACPTMRECAIGIRGNGRFTGLEISLKAHTACRRIRHQLQTRRPEIVACAPYGIGLVNGSEINPIRGLRRKPRDHERIGTNDAVLENNLVGSEFGYRIRIGFLGGYDHIPTRSGLAFPTDNGTGFGLIVRGKIERSDTG